MTTTVTSGGTIFTFTKTATNAKMTDLALKASHYLFDVGYGDHGTPEAPRTFAQLSNVERLTILDKYITNVLRDAAKSFHVNDAMAIARTTAEVSADFDLG